MKISLHTELEVLLKINIKEKGMKQSLMLKSFANFEQLLYKTKR